MRFLPVLLALAALAPAPARPAPASSGLIAVLPLQAGPQIDPVVRETLEETIRTSAGDQLAGRGYTVLTGETTLRVLADNGIDAQKACEASCALETARELHARHFVSGSIARLEGAYMVFVRLFTVDDGRQIASVQLEATGAREVARRFREEAPRFFAPITGPTAPAPGPAVAPAPTNEPLPEPTPEPAPPEPAGPRARLRVTTEPLDARITIDGRDAGSSPLELEVEPGQVHVVAEMACAKAVSSDVRAEEDEVAEVHLKLERLDATLAIEADPLPGGAVARVLVDGEDRGPAPATVQLTGCSAGVSVVAPDGSSWEPETRTFTPGTTTSLRAKWRARNMAVRVGFGGNTGLLGVGFEYRIGHLGVSLGTGVKWLTGGVTLALREQNAGGPYLDLHVTASAPGFIGDATSRGNGFGATLGWDFRPLRWLTVKVGGGLAMDTENIPDARLRILTFDAAAGVVF